MFKQVLLLALLLNIYNLVSQTKTASSNGSWGSSNNWTPAGVPTATNNVVIPNGRNIWLDVSAICNSLTINNGGTLRFSGGTARTLTVQNTIQVDNGGTFRTRNNSNQTHTVIAQGNIVNNGTLDFWRDANSNVIIVCAKNGNQTFSGTGTIVDLNMIVLNMGSTNANIFDITATSFSIQPNFLTLTNGTFKFSTATGFSLNPFTGTTSIPANAGLWINSANSTVTAGNTLTLLGKITVSNGILNIGNANDEDLISAAGTLSVTGGSLNVAGKYNASGANNFSMSGGTLTVASFSSTNASNAPFQNFGTASTFNMSGGLIVIPREGGTGAQDLGFINTGVTAGAVSNGTLQIGSTVSPANQTITINTNTLIPSLLINSANVTTRLLTNSLSVSNGITISSGTLNANNLDLSLGGNWNNSGGNFITGTGKVNFNGTTAQSIFKTGVETFNVLEFTNAGVKTFSSAIVAKSNFSINAGANVDVSTSNYQLSVSGNFINNGTFNSRSGLIHLNGTIAQTIGGSSTTNFNNITLGNLAGASLTNSENLLGTLTLTNGIFNTNAQAFTMVSTATASARIAQIISPGNITGNVIVQRFAPGGTTGWALLGSPMSSALTLQDWDDDIAISCPTCPDGEPPGGFLSVYTYSEAVNGLHDNPLAYNPLSGITDPITPGVGYWVYLGDGFVTTNNITLDVTGTVQKFNFPIPLTYNNYGSPADDGWNLITNPYPSPISWTLLAAGVPNLDNAVYIWNADLNGGAGLNATYINGVSSPAVGSGGIGNTIPMCQGFYVHSTGATLLNATEAIKVGGNPTFLKESQSQVPSSLVRLMMNGPNNYLDESVLYIQSGATNNFDDAYDAYKLAGQNPLAPSIALTNANNKFQINGVPPISGTFSMELKTLTGYSGNYTISATDFTTFPAGACFNLYDKFTNTSTDLKTNTYVFNLSDTTTVARFVLNITINPLNINSNVVQSSCEFPLVKEINAKGVNSGPWNFYWRDQQSNIIKTSLNKSGGDTLTGMNSGTYSLEINTVGQCDNNSSSYYINPIILPYTHFIAPDTIYLSQNSIVTFSNASDYVATQQWDFGDNIGTSIAFNPIYNYSSVGNFNVSLINISSTGCADTTAKKIVVLDTDVGVKNISENNSNLIIKTLENNEFLIEQKLNKTSFVNFKLQDAMGRLINDYGDFNSETINFPLNLNNYPSGIYYLRIGVAEKVTVVKLVVKQK